MGKSKPYTGRLTPPEKKRTYARARAEGMTIAAASREAKISRNTGYALEKQLAEIRAERGDTRPNRTISSLDATRAALSFGSVSARTMAAGRAGHGNPWANGYATLVGGDDLPGPVPVGHLCGEARAALEDFGLFRRRYLGRGPSPWQEDAAGKVVDLLGRAQESRDREFMVFNAPPGGGKSTLFTHDLSVWMICRDRRIRILIGSRTAPQATKYTRRIRQTLMRRSLAVPKEEDLRSGLAVMPEAVLAEDFGRFKPLGRADGDVWQAGGFTVLQHGDMLSTGEKEPTVTAFGFDSDYLGMRVDLAVWDDLVDPKNIRNEEVIEALKEDWDNVAEQRTDPGGLCVLQGQRLRHNDLYRHCLDKQRARDEEDGEEAGAGEWTSKYHSVVYRAHDEARCRGLHKRADPPWDPGDPEAGGCLLDPKRIPWRDLKTLMEKDPDTFRVVFQQEDLDPGSALVLKVWVDGGKDEQTGALHPGCWDHERSLWQWPEISGPQHLALVIDPSPSNFWAAQLWNYHQESERRFLIALDRRRMEAPELLDWNADRRCFTGFLDEWWQRSSEAGHPFRFVVVEVNVAQKWLLQYDHAKRWATLRGVTFVPHTTGVRKTDDRMGIKSLKTPWRTGRVRLPGNPDGSRGQCELLVREVLRYPHGTTDDQVLAQWFFEFTLPKLCPPKPRQSGPAHRPSWLGHGGRGLPEGWQRVFAQPRGA